MTHQAQSFWEDGLIDGVIGSGGTAWVHGG